MRLGSEGTVWLLFSLVLALFVPQISYVINPIGGLAAVLMFVFPGSFLYVCAMCVGVGECASFCLWSCSNELAPLDSNHMVSPAEMVAVCGWCGL